ncbi:MAG: hypothetical protein OEZ58_13310 [Gammaproteobacteria bacterium]|nr:hypothetical protein [Gammaproteobacteria bacterium]MDH5729967.1 hypothetical protein [Gammaproteobacteria bacterium]
MLYKVAILIVTVMVVSCTLNKEEDPFNIEGYANARVQIQKALARSWINIQKTNLSSMFDGSSHLATSYLGVNIENIAGAEGLQNLKQVLTSGILSKISRNIRSLVPVTETGTESEQQEIFIDEILYPWLAYPSMEGKQIIYRPDALWICDDFEEKEWENCYSIVSRMTLLQIVESEDSGSITLRFDKYPLYRMGYSSASIEYDLILNYLTYAYSEITKIVDELPEEQVEQLPVMIGIYQFGFSVDERENENQMWVGAPKTITIMNNPENAQSEYFKYFFEESDKFFLLTISENEEQISIAVDVNHSYYEKALNQLDGLPVFNKYEIEGASGKLELMVEDRKFVLSDLAIEDSARHFYGEELAMRFLLNKVTLRGQMGEENMVLEFDVPWNSELLISSIWPEYQRYFSESESGETQHREVRIQIDQATVFSQKTEQLFQILAGSINQIVDENAIKSEQRFESGECLTITNKVILDRQTC